MNVTVTYVYSCGHELVSHAFLPFAGPDESAERTEHLERPCPWKCRPATGKYGREEA